MEGTRWRSVERDPVCGMQVDPEKARARAEHAGRPYYFCCPGCAQKFQAAPGKYLAPRPAPSGPSLMVIAPAGSPKPAAMLPPPAAVLHSHHGKASAVTVSAPGTSVEYTCPMDPEIIQIGPGVCPKCGMALEPRTMTAEEGPNEELISMTRRFWVSVAL